MVVMRGEDWGIDPRGSEGGLWGFWVVRSHKPPSGNSINC